MIYAVRAGEFWSAFDGRAAHAEQGSGFVFEVVGLVPWMVGGGDVEFVEVFAAEGGAAYLGGGESEFGELFSGGGVSDQPMAVPLRGPEAAFGIDGHAVGEAFVFRDGDDGLAVGDLA